jgi:hypothetical protein
MSCDFLLWVRAKDKVYKSKSRMTEECENKLCDVFANVLNDTLRKSVENVPVRLQNCVHNAGTCVEF